jgi:hypothetical protein
MSSQYSYGQPPKASLKRTSKMSPQFERRGVPDTGRIVKLLVGQGHGFIRLATDREIYFHRADVQEGTSINDFDVGDIVAFERLDDHISGARALGVRRHRQSR